jgi:hypothetical protein
MVWFGVVIAMNLQTSFLTPPFGFALFYLRSVAAKNDYKDRITGATIPAVTTAQIYKGSIAFIVLQIIMVAAIIAWPKLVVSGLDDGPKIDPDKALEQMRVPAPPQLAPAPTIGAPSAPGASAPAAAAPAAPAPAASGTAAADDPMKAVLDALKREQDGGKK